MSYHSFMYHRTWFYWSFSTHHHLVLYNMLSVNWKGLRELFCAFYGAYVAHQTRQRGYSNLDLVIKSYNTQRMWQIQTCEDSGLFFGTESDRFPKTDHFSVTWGLVSDSKNKVLSSDNGYKIFWSLAKIVSLKHFGKLTIPLNSYFWKRNCVSASKRKPDLFTKQFASNFTVNGLVPLFTATVFPNNMPEIISKLKNFAKLSYLSWQTILSLRLPHPVRTISL